VSCVALILRRSSSSCFIVLRRRVSPVVVGSPRCVSSFFVVVLRCGSLQAFVKRQAAEALIRMGFGYKLCTCKVAEAGCKLCTCIAPLGLRHDGLLLWWYIVIFSGWAAGALAMLQMQREDGRGGGGGGPSPILKTKTNPNRRANTNLGIVTDHNLQLWQQKDGIHTHTHTQARAHVDAHGNLFLSIGMAITPHSDHRSFTKLLLDRPALPMCLLGRALPFVCLLLVLLLAFPLALVPALALALPHVLALVLALALALALGLLDRLRLKNGLQETSPRRTKREQGCHRPAVHRYNKSTATNLDEQHKSGT